MDLFDESREDRFIDEYLYQACKSNPDFDASQQFAKPIEDEDLFAPTIDQPNPLTSAQIKIRQIRENFLRQAREASIKPKKIEENFGAGDFIEVEIDGEAPSLVSRLLNKPKNPADATVSPGKKHQSWDSYKDILLKQISAKKRRNWDSLHGPTDNFDEEEELIEDPSKQDDSPEGDEDENEEAGDKDQDQDSDDDNESVRAPGRPMDLRSDDGNFEDLEREELEADASNDNNSEASPDPDLQSDDDEEMIVDDEMPDEDGDDLGSEHMPDDCDVDDDEEEKDEDDKVPSNRESDESDDSQTGDDFDLALDDDSAEVGSHQRRRAIFIDDEASED